MSTTISSISETKFPLLLFGLKMRNEKKTAKTASLVLLLLLLLLLSRDHYK